MAKQTISAAVARLTDWETRLTALVAERLQMPFAWGAHDCVLFAADCIQAVTGVDPVADLRGQWHDQSSAVRSIARLGGLQTAVTQRMGLPVGALYAQRGDLVLHCRDGTEALAVCLGEHLAGPSESGLLFFGLENGVKAWRV